MSAERGCYIIGSMKSKQMKSEKEQWRLLRKSRSDLIVAGKAVLAFGVWTMLKVLLELFLSDRNVETYIDDTIEISRDIQMAVVIGMFVVVGLFAMLIHFIIYRGAVKEGHGRKTGYLYLVIAMLFIGLSCYSIYNSILFPSAIEQGVLSYFSSVLFDLALVICCFDVIYNGIMCKRLKRELNLQ